MADRTLTPMQQKFLDVLYDEADADMAVAKQLAGYSSSTSLKAIIEGLKDELVDLARTHLAMHSLKAARAMTDALADPTTLGIKERMRASEQILDRVGVAKTENVKLEITPNSIIVLPAKD